ncbi:MAG: hypothetical protein ACRDJC_08895 [Thermomicrobiales bacterium]
MPLPRWFALVVLLIVFAGDSRRAEAQDIPPAGDENPFAELELPTIAVTITNDAFTGVPPTLPAGRYLLSVTNEFSATDEETEGAAFLRLPEGRSAADFIREMAPAEPDASGEEAVGSLPSWYGETTLAGGPYAFLGETAYAVVDLTAGEWILWSEAPGAPQAPVPVTVTGKPPADPPAPTADVTVELSDFAIDLSAPLHAGPQVIEVVNTGAQPHFVFIGEVPEGTTVDDAMTAFDAFFNAASVPADVFSFADTPELLGTGDQSPGTKVWYALDLPASTVVIACFMTDPETGMLHATLGMTEIVVIEA